MPRRLTPFAPGEFYHLFNRSIHRQPIFGKKRDVQIFKELVMYYTQTIPPIKFSYYRSNPDKYVVDFSNRLVTIISFCHMPNHFHFSVKQEVEGGVQKFMQRILNSFSHYYSIKHDNRGPLFETTFKAVHIETDEQLIHLSRYHHLNPVTAYLVEHPKDYPHSSYQNYLGQPSQIIDVSYVLSHFRSVTEYERFVLDQKDYQRELDTIKHMVFDKQ